MGVGGSIAVNYTLLSFGAVASQAEVERSLRTLMKSLDDARVEPDSLPERVVICAVPDLDTAWRSTLKGGRFRSLHVVEMSEAGDVRITARSDDLIALIEGRLNVGFAFLTGKVKVQAPASDLMMIRRLF